jgi:FKBP-type peptidyl-prolyl cis-trans isomerase FkpA
MKNILSGFMCMAALLACQDIQSQKEFIETTPSGYRYSIADDVAGEKAVAGNFVMLHVKMSHQDSVISDSRQDRANPTIVKIDDAEARKASVSRPIQDLLCMLSKGDSARIYYPLDSFKVKPPKLQHLKEVAYDIKVVDIFRTEQEMNAYFLVKQEQEEAEGAIVKKMEPEIAQKVAAFYTDYKNKTKKQVLQTTESGLQYVIQNKSGTGVRATLGDYVRTQYYGILASDGTMFDNSFRRGMTFDFTIGGDPPVMEGWKEAFQILEKGDKGFIVVPGNLAYGSNGYPGLIPPDATLIFYVELVGVGELE